MADKKPINNTGIQGGSFEGELTQDIRRFFKAANQWTHARNAVNNTVVGDVGDLSNEASNYLCVTVPYTIIGAIHIESDEWAVFSTNNVDSEIGLFREGECFYKKLVNDPCLGFNKEHLIKGVGRSSATCGKNIYWDDGLNPSRWMDVTKPPWVQSCVDDGSGCIICADTNKLDCDKLRLAALMTDLSFRLAPGNGSGQLLNGSYYVVGAYLVEGQRVTDYCLPSNIQGLFSHDNLSSSLDIYVEEADPEYDEFQLVIVQFANFSTVARVVGTYSTRQKKITLDHIDETWPTIDPGVFLIQNSIADKSDAIYRNGEYLLRVGPTSKLDFNYQPLANQIKTQWVSVEYDADYYRKGGTNTGYMRDEIYAYFIRWVYNTGDKSRSYHIPGRIALPSDLSPIAGDDVLPSDVAIRWKVYNTATLDPGFTGTGGILPDGGVILGGGDMAYWESSEKYEDKNPEVWNASSDPMWGSNNPAHDLCGRYIRHHKFPDNATDNLTGNMITNHYDPSNGNKIRVMGVQFSNIKPPLDNNGNPITSIVGYEILRGSREGNKTVLAKGMINNLREYISIDKDPGKKFLYPNYPYNPTAKDPRYNGGQDVVDHYLSALSTKYDGGGAFSNTVDAYNAYLEDDVPLGRRNTLGPDGTLYFQNGTNILNDMITFHGPDTNFRNPFLSAKEVKVYGELHGTMVGRFQLPKDHPRHKFITDTAFVISAIVGIGYALLSTEGEKTTRYRAPQILMGGTYTNVGTTVGTTGLFGPSAVAASTQIAGTAISGIADALVNSSLSHSMLSTLLSALGIDPNGIRDVALQTSGMIGGAISGQGGQMEYEHASTPWSATPDWLRLTTGIPAFVTFWSEGVDKLLELIYAFTPYRHYALQQISHCYYDQFVGPDIGDMRREILYQNYLSPGFQDFAQTYRINNLYRSRTVALKLHSDLALPYKQVDDTQAIFSDVWDRVADAHRWENEENINSSFNRPASSHYVAIKQRLDNQYGQLSGIMQVPVSTNYTSINNSKSEVLFNGDVYIGRYTEKNTMFFFYDWLKGQPDGTDYNYKLRKMITHPRFWMDTEPFDAGEFISSLSNLLTGGSGAPAGFDVFMLANPNNPAPCQCGNLANCFFDPADLTDICNLEADLEQAQFWVDFLEDCACYLNKNHEPGCNDDNQIPDPATEPEYSNCFACQGGCPNYHSIWRGTDAEAGRYLEDDKGKWKRKIRRAEKKVRQIQRKLNKKRNKLYEDYVDSMDGDQDSAAQDLFDAIITPSDKFAFDQRRTQGLLRLSIKEAFMYLFNSGIRDFYVETEINLDYRDWGEKPEERHYDHLTYTDLKELFNTDHIKVGNYMKYDFSLSISKLFNNYVSWGLMQDRRYNPKLAETCYVYRPKRVIYSLPQTLENNKDNWRVFLPLNYKDFNSVVTAIKPISKNGAIMMFENESPIQFLGVDSLETDSGTKVTIGDGGLFSQPLQNLVNADYPNEYGSCQSRLSVINTPAGTFYMSQNQGKIFQVTADGLSEISASDLKWWFARYLPYQLTQHPTAFYNPVTGEQIPFDLTDNPVIGIGCQAIYDNENAVVFFCKKDWVIRDDIEDVITYLGGDTFLVNGRLKVKLGDPAYFLPASWTISWDPKANSGAGAWISWHDWHPDLVLPSKHTYMTTKENGIWIHADRCDSYCNFYGVDYPFEIEFSLPSTGEVSTLRNIIYLMEVYLYGKNCDDRFHELDFNFDEAVIYNSEQCSGLLKLNLKPKNNAPDILNYPKINFASIDILYSKEEQKYRFNQFWDITADRGEYNPQAQRTVFITLPNGYERQLNPANLDYNKPAFERKKFRHYMNNVWLSRRVSGNRNMVVSMAVQMNLNSPR